MVLVVAVFCTALLTGYLIVRLRRRTQEEPGIDMVVDDVVTETAATVEEMSPEEKKRREREEFILDLARNEPQNMVALLRTWMSED
jgi:flagellar M-ring protein FliF